MLDLTFYPKDTTKNSVSVELPVGLYKDLADAGFGKIGTYLKQTNLVWEVIELPGEVEDYGEWTTVEVDVVKLSKVNRRAFDLLLLNEIAAKAKMLHDSVADTNEVTEEAKTACYLLQTLEKVRNYINNDEYLYLEV